LAGSYFVEAMTDRIEREAEEYLTKIDSLGGMIEAIEAGYVQTEIQTAAYKCEMEIEEGKQVIVGVNKYQVKEESPKDLLRININVQEEQIKFLSKVKAERNNIAVQEKLSALKTAARGTENLMPLILDAVRAYASVGEISNAMREVFGEYKEHVVI
ncbi:MAG: methylmalonyl-CoA mutase, partial [Ignavibacteria bacterium CG_4_9_14_3_um_filter_36_18]